VSNRAIADANLTYGVAEDAGIVRAQRLLPIGIAEVSKLKRNVPKDRALTYDDVDLPAGRLSVALRVEQDARFGPG
jgi:predicted homoserine dehydrogenase-like protein